MNRGLIEVLRQWADDPMWADHAEVPKIVLRKAADRIAALEAEASENARLLGQAGEKIANLSGEIDRLKRDLARVEAEALERAAKVANSDADERIGSLQAGAGRRIRDAIRALIPEAPAQRELGSSAANQISMPEVGLPEAPAREGWQPISSAPKDGTVVDLWHEDFGRQADFKWGHTEHSCGEAGRYCDSDWHSEEAGWVDTALNERFFTEDAFTHWRPLPPPPQDREEQ